MKKNLIFSILMLTMLISCTNNQDNQQEESQAGKKIIESGELASVETRSVVMPRFGRFWYSMKITGVLNHGTVVKKGDSILQLDGTEIKKYIIERESQFATQNAVLEKLKVDQANRVLELQSRLKNEIASFELKKLELESSKFDTEKNRKVKLIEFEQAKLNLKKVQRSIELNKRIAAYTLQIEQIKTDQLKNEIKDAYAILPKLTLRAPISGIFQVANNRRTGTPVKIGDEIYQGNLLGSVPDLTWMKVNTSVNETDYLKIKTRQKVNVRMDALPKVVFKGEVNYLGKLCHRKDEKSKEKVFDVEVKILKPDSRLKPGMTVSCEYIP